MNADMPDAREAPALESPRLLLRPYAPAHFLALIDGVEAFHASFGLPAADGLREFIVSGEVSPQWLEQLRSASGVDMWTHGFAIIDRATHMVIGNVGFKGAPDANGMVEIAYAVVPAHENKGIATEAAGLLVSFAFADPRVRLIRAHTLPGNTASGRVLLKNGFTNAGEVVDPDDGLVCRWERWKQPRETSRNDRNMQRITPCLWFNNCAEEAVALYTSLFGGASIGKIARYGKEGAKVSGQPEGAVMTMKFTLAGQEFLALNGGPHYHFSPAISLCVNCDTADEVDRVWQGLSQGGKVLMDLGQYPFSERFGWCQDKFGLSWQVNFGARPQKINPFLMFVQEKHGKAAEAMEFFASIFDNAKIVHDQRFGPGQHEPEGALMQGMFALDGYEFRAMDSAMDHQFGFTGAISFIVNCESQADIDRYWDALTGCGGKESRCGWLEDRYGISWQIVPTALGKLMEDPEGGQHVMRALFQMRKLDVAALEQAARAAV